MRYSAFVVVLLMGLPSGLLAQDVQRDPPLPATPDSFSRSADGTRAIVRATRLTAPLMLDGRLDEPLYRDVRPVANFVQNIPDHGQPATQPTEAWVAFDHEAIFVSARCWDQRPEAEWTANERRRDQLALQDTFGVSLDTFHDHRNAVNLYTNALGAQGDSQITNETGTNQDFNPVWEVRSGRFEGGWTVEMRIPFASLRYRPGREQEWGIQLRRNLRVRNEYSYAVLLPAGLGPAGMMRVSLGATLVGLEAPSGGRNLEIKPYVIATVLTDTLATPALSRDVSGDVGVDLKYSVTRNLTADFTYNTDVAAAEADDQQVNLTRFNLSLPEKRDFFLEGQGIFQFSAGGGPSLFYSRRIGLNRGRVVPIIAGGRMTGKVGGTAIGVLSVTTGEEAVTGAPRTNVTVLRARRDVLRRSSVGAIVTNRSQSLAAPGRASAAYGVDGSFGFHDNLYVDALYARSDAPGHSAAATHTAAVDYRPDRFGLSASHLFVADGFSPEVGFVARDDIRQTSVAARFSPRPRSVPHVERVSLTGSAKIIENTAGMLESRTAYASVATEFENGDEISARVTEDLDRLFVPFQIAPGVTIPAGRYTFRTLRAAYERAAQRAVSGLVSFEHGGFYGGRDSTLGYAGRVSMTRALALQPSVDVRWIRLPQGSFTSQLWRTRLIYTFTPQMFLSGLMQYNTSNHVIGLNFRLRWEYLKGSELFVVYNENQRADAPGGAFSQVLDRAVSVKVNRLLRF